VWITTLLFRPFQGFGFIPTVNPGLRCAALRPGLYYFRAVGAGRLYGFSGGNSRTATAFMFVMLIRQMDFSC
jgi:hypothetical protein